MNSTFPAAINGDLLKLVHMSNSFQIIEGTKPLQVCEICCPKAHIVSVTTLTKGRVVKVKGPVIEVVSSFLYRGRFIDYGNSLASAGGGCIWVLSSLNTASYHGGIPSSSITTRAMVRNDCVQVARRLVVGLSL